VSPRILALGIAIVNRGAITPFEMTVSHPLCGLNGDAVKSMRLDNAGTSDTQTQFVSKTNCGLPTLIRLHRAVFTALYCPQHSRFAYSPAIGSPL
jgi:hypothetical protein